MATQLEIVRLLAPEFSGVSDQDVQKFLDIAPLYIDPERLTTEKRGLALALKACSLMLSQKDSIEGLSSGGALQSEKEGDLMRSYSTMDKNGRQVKNIYEQQLDLVYYSAGSSILCP